MFRFERLRVWHKAIELYDAVDDMAEGLAGSARSNLANQLRRAALSVSSNIAEGSGRETAKDSQHFYTVAKGSTFEVVSIAAVCQRRGMISAEKYREIYQRVEDIAKMLSGLKRVGRPAQPHARPWRTRGSQCGCPRGSGLTARGSQYG